LLTAFDAETRATYPDLIDLATPPDRANVGRALDELGALAADDKAKGRRSVMYFIYIGHGARRPDGQGYVTLADTQLTRNDLSRLLLDRPNTSTWSKPDSLHVIVDACAAYFLVKTGGRDLIPMPDEYQGQFDALFDSQSPTRYPFAGFLLATSGDVQVHEWDGYRAGVFSHLVRAGLSGNADTDGDGIVSYAEMREYLAARSEEIADPRARLHVAVMPPPGSARAPLFTLDRGEPRRLAFGAPETVASAALVAPGSPAISLAGERMPAVSRRTWIAAGVALGFAAVSGAAFTASTRMQGGRRQTFADLGTGAAATAVFTAIVALSFAFDLGEKADRPR
jgi:hypothetical protein